MKSSYNAINVVLHNDRAINNLPTTESLAGGLNR